MYIQLERDMESAPLFSIIIPARDEEKFLPRCLSGIAAAVRVFDLEIGRRSEGRPLAEIIVVVNRSWDRTEEIARAAGCRICRDESKNLAKIRNAGARCARGEIIITIDADSVMSSRTLLEIHRALMALNAVGGGILLLPERWSIGIVCTMICLLPIVLWHRISGGLFYCYRSDFEAIGGFNETLVSVEDIDFAKRLKSFGRSRGKRFKTIWRAHIVSSCRKFDRLGDWYFILHPVTFWKLLRGESQIDADKIWYDFEH